MTDQTSNTSPRQLMGKYKMPLSQDKAGRIVDADGKPVFWDITLCRNVTIAVNSHDRLTAENARLREDNERLRIELQVTDEMLPGHFGEPPTKTASQVASENARLREALEHVTQHAFDDDTPVKMVLADFEHMRDVARAALEG